MYIGFKSCLFPRIFNNLVNLLRAYQPFLRCEPDEYGRQQSISQGQYALPHGESGQAGENNCFRGIINDKIYTC